MDRTHRTHRSHHRLQKLYIKTTTVLLKHIRQTTTSIGTLFFGSSQHQRFKLCRKSSSMSVLALDTETICRRPSVSVSAIDTTAGENQRTVLPSMYSSEIEEHQQMIWPALSISEVQDRPSTKRARHNASCSSVEICSDASFGHTADSISLLEFGNNGKSGGQQQLPCKNDEQKLGTWKLQKSNRLCSPFVLGDRGCEIWRDFL